MVDEPDNFCPGKDNYGHKEGNLGVWAPGNRLNGMKSGVILRVDLAACLLCLQVTLFLYTQGNA